MTARRASCILTGELDLATVGHTWRVALAALDGGGPDLMLDLSAVTFMDCAGLAPLIRLRQEARLRGGRLILTGVTGTVRRLLALTGLTVAFGVEETLDHEGATVRRVEIVPSAPARVSEPKPSRPLVG